MNDLTDGLVITKRFRTATEFSLYIENRVLETKTGYMDSIIAYCTEADINIESIGKLVNTSLKEKIRCEAEEQNYMKPRAKLPI
jgi:hypothetical protein